MQTTLPLSNHTRLSLAILPASAPYQPQEAHPQLWETGPEKWVQTQLIDLIRRAQEMICVQSFIMDDNPVIEALADAAKRGVAVFVTGATVKLGPPEEEPEFRTESYKKLLENTFKGQILFRAADHFHAKFVLIDPQTQPQGVLLTANLTTKALSRNPELALPLNQAQVKELYQQFRYHFWEEAQEEHTDQKEFVGVKSRENFSLPAAKQILFTQKQTEQQVLRQALLTAIEGAQQSICLSTYNLDPSHPVAEAILQKNQAGLAVKLFFPERANKIKEACLPFLKAGAEVFIQPYLHAKALLVDGTQGYIFSANVEKYGLDQGWETGIQLNQVQAKELRQRFETWTRHFGKLKHDLPIEDHLGPIRVLNGELKSHHIQPSGQQHQSLQVTSFQQVQEKLKALKPEPFFQQTTFHLTFSFPSPPAKFEKKRELIPGLWEIERPGKKGKPSRNAWLIAGDFQWASLPAQLTSDQLNWPVYEK